MAVIFEGEDAKYFGPRFDMLRPGLEWFPINSGGRGIVLELYRLITGHSSYGSSKTYFFIDRDFNEIESLPKSPFFIHNSGIFC